MPEDRSDLDERTGQDIGQPLHVKDRPGARARPDVTLHEQSRLRVEPHRAQPENPGQDQEDRDRCREERR